MEGVEEGTNQVRTRATGWFGVVVFARLYTTVLCDFIGSIPGLDFICHTVVSDRWWHSRRAGRWAGGQDLKPN